MEILLPHRIRSEEKAIRCVCAFVDFQFWMDKERSRTAISTELGSTVDARLPDRNRIEQDAGTGNVFLMHDGKGSHSMRRLVARKVPSDDPDDALPHGGSRRFSFPRLGARSFPSQDANGCHARIASDPSSPRDGNALLAPLGHGSKPTRGSIESGSNLRSTGIESAPNPRDRTEDVSDTCLPWKEETLVHVGLVLGRKGVAREEDIARGTRISCNCMRAGSKNVSLDPGTDTKVDPDASGTSEDPRRREGTRGGSYTHSRMVWQARIILSLIMVLVTAFVSEGTSSGSEEAGHGIEQKGDALAVALDGSAFLSSYYLGVLDSLAELGIVQPGITRVSGISAGSLVALASCMSYPFHDALNLMKEVAERCIETWQPKKEALPCQGHLYEEVKWIVEQIIGDDPDAYKKCSGKLRTFLLALNPKTRGQTRSETHVIEQFESNQDLAEGVQAATFVPCWSSCRPYVIYRGMPVIDGAFEMPLERICPDGASPCIRVQVNYPGKHRKAPHVPCSLSGSQLLCFGENHVRTLGCFPGERTAPFEARGILPKRCPYFPLRVPTAMRNANIFPGMFAENPLPSTCYRHQCGLMIPEPSSLDSLFELGRKDATLWASEQQSYGM